MTKNLIEQNVQEKKWELEEREPCKEKKKIDELMGCEELSK